MIKLAKLTSLVSTLQFKLALALLLTCLVFVGGWTVRGWKDDAQASAIVAATQEVKDAFHVHEANVAGLLGDKLDKLKANKTTVEKHYEQIVDRPVYRNICLDDDGLRILDAARLGAAPASAASQALP